MAEISIDQPVSRPAVSQHLKTLQQAGLVDVRKAGTKRLYSINRTGIQEMRDYLDSYWDDVLDAYRNAVENSPGGHTK